MNDHDLDLALADLGTTRVRPVAPPILHHLIRTMPLTSQRRGWLPTFPTWRFQTMFNATKFVAAGAIVALAGGLLITGTLTGPSSDTVPPGAGSPSTVPTVVPAVIRSTLDLQLQESRPGVYNVESDGIRTLARDVIGVTVDADGGVWVVKRPAPGDRRLVKLGETGTVRSVGSIPVLGSLPDGRPHLQSKDESVTLTDGAWAQSDRQICAWRRPQEVSVGGTCWGVDTESVDAPVMYQVVDGEQRVVAASELGLIDGETVGALGADRAGNVWAAVMAVDPATAGAFEGLVTDPGSGWTRVPYQPGDGEPELGTPIEVAVGPDGTVWVVTEGDRSISATSWDGETWTSYGPVQPNFGEGKTHFLPDGTIWFLEGAAVFDGDRLVAPTFPNVGPLAFGPDGRGWVLADGRLVVIDPVELLATE